ncbi:MAG: hypothetical protein M1812_005190 [Candelaria pacifica]|nr:MAG: hypothetical protein M1812_005190 [Candelaria pacifica]
MKAVRFYGQKDIRLEDIEVPKLSKGQVKLKPAFVGICGSDLHEYLEGANLIPTTPHPITGETAPVTLGHEFSGIVEEVGEGINDMKAGDRVVIQPSIYDSTCGACREGLINCCYSNGGIGLVGWGGGLSEHCVVFRRSLFHLPENIPLKIGALVEPIAVAWHAVKISPYKPDDAVLVLGGGPIGLAVVQTLKARNCEKIIVSEVAPRRKEFAKDFGAHYVLDPTKDDIVARCRELCDGQGVNITFDAAGVQAGLNQAVSATKVRGTIVNIAVWPKPATINVNELVFGEKRYMGTTTYTAEDYHEVIDALSLGKLKPDGMITRKIKLNEVEEKGFKALIHDKENHVKILVEVQG